MSHRVLSACAALLMGLSVVSPAAAQSGEEGEPDYQLCRAAFRAIEPPAGRYPEDLLEEYFYRAAGATAADSDSVRRHKVAEMFKRRPATSGKRGLPYCDRTAFLWEGSLLWISVDHSWTEGALWMIEAGADPNLVDSRTGRTVLDDVQGKMDAYSRGSEAFSVPVAWSRDSYVKGFINTYHQLRKVGAKHAFELKTPPLAGIEERERRCLQATPADGPGEVGSFDGILNPKLSELTPGTVSGGTRVSSRQAACLMEAYGKDIMVIGVIKDDVGLPESIKFPFIGYSGTFDDQYQDVTKDIVKISQSKPILVYCHSPKCYLSYNAVIRLRKEGASKVFWLRDGINGWRNAGYPTATPDDFLYRVVTRTN